MLISAAQQSTGTQADIDTGMDKLNAIPLKVLAAGKAPEPKVSVA